MTEIPQNAIAAINMVLADLRRVIWRPQVAQAIRDFNVGIKLGL